VVDSLDMVFEFGRAEPCPRIAIGAAGAGGHEACLDGVDSHGQVDAHLVARLGDVPFAMAAEVLAHLVEDVSHPRVVADQVRKRRGDGRGDASLVHAVSLERRPFPGQGLMALPRGIRSRLIGGPVIL
jgi:hypothetical protein